MDLCRLIRLTTVARFLAPTFVAGGCFLAVQGVGWLDLLGSIPSHESVAATMVRIKQAGVLLTKAHGGLVAPPTFLAIPLKRPTIAAEPPLHLRHQLELLLLILGAAQPAKGFGSPQFEATFFCSPLHRCH
jgi:hypothetical protein